MNTHPAGLRCLLLAGILFTCPWKIGETCRFLVRASTNANKTAFAAWFHLNARKSWKHLVTFQTLTKGEPLRGSYSFIEDFRRDTRSVHDLRRARFRNSRSGGACRPGRAASRDGAAEGGECC